MGFSSYYVVKTAVTKKKYAIIGYKGKQVRDNIHSSDLVSMLLGILQKTQAWRSL